MLKLKAQKPQVTVACTANAPDVSDEFESIFKRYKRKEGLKHYRKLQAIRAKSLEKGADLDAIDAEAQAEVSKHLIQVNITDSDGAKHKVKGDDLAQLFESTPYFIALLDGAEEALDNVKKQGDDRLGNLNVLATLLQASKPNPADSTTKL